MIGSGWVIFLSLENEIWSYFFSFMLFLCSVAVLMYLWVGGGVDRGHFTNFEVRALQNGICNVGFVLWSRVVLLSTYVCLIGMWSMVILF